MRARDIISLSFLVSVTLFVACKKKEEPPAPEPIPIPAPTTGDIKGQLFHLDQFGVSYTTALNNGSVSIEGTSISASTDTEGKFTLTQVPAGNHTLVFKKPGCGIIKVQGLVYKISDLVFQTASVADLPNFSITSAQVKDTTWFDTKIPGIYYRAYSAETNTNASTVAILSKTPNGNIADPSSYINFPSVSKISVANDYARFVSYSFLKDSYDLSKDDVLYIKVYPVSAAASFYFDSKLNKPVFTAFGTGLPQTFTLAIP